MGTALGADHPPPPRPRAPLVRVTLHHVALVLTQPFQASHGREERREVVVVEAEDGDGFVGWGECDALSRPTYTHEYAAGAFRLLADLIVPAHLGGAELGGPLGRHQPMAVAGLVAARCDLDARRQGLSLAGALGATREALPRATVIGQQPSTDALLNAVGRALDGGAALVKLKLGTDADRMALAAVRDAFPAATLAADANGAFAGVPAAELAWVDGADLAYLEQPYPADDLLSTAALAATLGTPVALDESITSRGSAEVALAVGALRPATGSRGAGLVNIKAARLGGLTAASELARWARSAGLSVFCGGMVELGVGRAAAAALAAGDAFDVPTDLGPSSQYVVEDLTDPLEVDGAGRLVLPLGPGIGVAPHADRLARATIARATVAAR